MFEAGKEACWPVTWDMVAPDPLRSFIVSEPPVWLDKSTCRVYTHARGLDDVHVESSVRWTTDVTMYSGSMSFKINPPGCYSVEQSYIDWTFSLHIHDNLYGSSIQRTRTNVPGKHREGFTWLPGVNTTGLSIITRLPTTHFLQTLFPHLRNFFPSLDKKILGYILDVLYSDTFPVHFLWHICGFCDTDWPPHCQK